MFDSGKSGSDKSPVQIQKGRFGLSVVTTRNIRWGEEIFRFQDCEILEQPTPRTLQLSPFEFALEPKVVANIDHSCDPNTLIDIARRSLIANQDIPEGAHLTRFYPSTEWILVEPFRCLCGAKGCIGEVRGAKFLDSEILFRHYISAQIRELYHALGDLGQPAHTRPNRRPNVLGERRRRLKLVGQPEYTGQERRQRS
jgi:hypothetical protein